LYSVNSTRQINSCEKALKSRPLAPTSAYQESRAAGNERTAHENCAGAAFCCSS
jgi:hypothetical protein